MTFGAKINAQKTFLADFFINFNIALQNQSPPKLISASYLAYNEKKVKYFKKKYSEY
jgi:hypothetical protein